MLDTYHTTAIMVHESILPALPGDSAKGPTPEPHIFIFLLVLLMASSRANQHPPLKISRASFTQAGLACCPLKKKNKYFTGTYFTVDNTF